MDVWDLLETMSGQYCYTLTYNIPVTVEFFKYKAIITYRSGNTLEIGRDEIEAAWDKLKSQNTLNANEVYAITRQYRLG